jgi:predicted ester cyclase
MSLEENKTLMRQWTDGINRGDPAIVDETCVPDWASELGGHEGVKGYLTAWFAAFPDGAWTIDEMVAEGEKVATAYTFTGTNTGEFQGRAPTGKKVTFKGVWIDDIKDGKFVGSPRGMQDRLAWMTELGMVTPS